MPRNKAFDLPMPGGCRCGQVSYRVTEAPRFTFVCHCTDCQQLTSSAFSLGMAVPAAGFEQHGTVRCWEKRAESGGWSRQFTCPECAGWTHTRTENAPDVVIVRPSTLDDRDWVRPVGQIFTRSARPWALLRDVALSYETEFDDPAPLAAAFAASDMHPQNS